jgi:hypothetical protein
MNKLPLSPKWRRVLEALATGRESGSAEAVLRARGFSAEMLKSLACVGLATPIGGQLAPRMRITELGRQMLGTIVATDERAPIDKAVNESKQIPANLIAVRRH